MKQIILTILAFSIINCKAQIVSQEQDSVTARNIIEQADKLFDESKYYEVISILSKLNEGYTQSDYLLGLSYLRIRDYGNAKKIFTRLYNEYPSYRHTCFNLAQCYLESTDWNNTLTIKTPIINMVVDFLTNGIELKKGHISDEYLAQYYSNRGQMLQLRADLNRAISDFNNAISLDPQGDYFTRRAMTYRFMGDNEKACVDFNTGRKLGQIYDEEELKTICP